VAQRVTESIEVEASRPEVFNYWSNFENFSNFMENVEEVRKTGGDTSHWKVKGPLGKSVEWEARTTEMDPERGIAWNSIEGSEVNTAGEARFEEVGPGRTRIEVTMNYSDPPGGAIGEAAAKLLQDPDKSLRRDLENFKQLVESGGLGSERTV
jgi:uncharacterized membrane protein